MDVVESVVWAGDRFWVDVEGLRDEVVEENKVEEAAGEESVGEKELDICDWIVDDGVIELPEVVPLLAIDDSGDAVTDATVDVIDVVVSDAEAVVEVVFCCTVASVVSTEAESEVDDGSGVVVCVVVCPRWSRPLAKLSIGFKMPCRFTCSAGSR